MIKENEGISIVLGMGTDVTVRNGMSHHNFQWTKLDIKPPSRGSSTNSSLHSRQFRLPIYSHHYGLSKAIVCVSAKIHNRRWDYVISIFLFYVVKILSSDTETRDII